MTLDELLAPKPASAYAHLTAGGEVAATLAQAEACTVLKCHDYGVDSLTPEEKQQLHAVIAKLKDQLWP